MALRAKIPGSVAFSQILERSRKADLPATAGSLAFTTVLSIVPMLAVAFYVSKAFGGFYWAYDRIMPFLLSVLSEGAGDVISVHLANFIENVHAKAVGWAGIGGLFVTATMTYFTVLKAFSRIWEMERHPPLLKRLFRALTLFTAGPILLASSLAVTGAVAAHAKGIPYSGQFVAYLLTVLLFIIVYKLVPLVRIPTRAIVIGSLVAGALLESAKLGYAVYAKRMVSYSAFYGSFAAIPLFLLWIYIAWYITLFGAVCVRTLQVRRSVQ